MNWSNNSWNEVEPIYQKIINMPFIQELASGKLSSEKFEFYIEQDACYLQHYGRVLAMIAAKAPNLDVSLSFVRFSETALVVESSLHQSFLNNLEQGIKIQPACHHYINYLKSTVAFEPIEVSIASVLPCFWIYKKVGDYLLKNHISINNPYQKWIDTYGGEDFAASVKKAIDISNEMADGTTDIIRRQMTNAFVTASRMEFLFWDGAYNFCKWSDIIV